MGNPAIWTVGHSTHGLTGFLGLLQAAGVEVVADVRSQPASRRNPQFNRGVLRAALLEAQIGYVFLGAELGGRPPEPEFYDSSGRVLYGAMAGTERFAAGLERLLQEAGGHRVAILCSEEDPARCHRRLLVGRVLAGRGVSLRHIRGDGRIMTESDLAPLPQEVTQDTLFGPGDPAWKSARPASPSVRARLR
jgi:uncharacterized protein (DUF488 family)